MKTLTNIAISAALLSALYIGLSRESEYYRIHQEELGLIQENAYILGWEARQQEYFNEVAEIAAQIHGE